MKMTIIASVVIVIVVGFYIFTRWHGQVEGGGGIEHIVPDTAKTNDPTLIAVVLSARKSARPLNTRFTNISLHYKLMTESTYSVAKPIQAPLPDKYQTMGIDMEYEKYNFFLPLYPVGTRGEIEYYVDVIFDGKPIHSEGAKKIMLVD